MPPSSTSASKRRGRLVRRRLQRDGTALEKSELRYRHLIHNMPVALWQLNAQPLVTMFRELRSQGVEDLSAYIDGHPEFLSNAIDALHVEEVNDYTIQLFGARNRNELLGPLTSSLPSISRACS
jgi:hypothetical protein